MPSVCAALSLPFIIMEDLPGRIAEEVAALPEQLRSRISNIEMAPATIARQSRTSSAPEGERPVPWLWTCFLRGPESTAYNYPIKIGLYYETPNPEEAPDVSPLGRTRTGGLLVAQPPREPRTEMWGRWLTQRQVLFLSVLYHGYLTQRDMPHSIFYQDLPANPGLGDILQHILTFLREPMEYNDT
jgi:hypothetical protein